MKKQISFIFFTLILISCSKNIPMQDNVSTPLANPIKHKENPSKDLPKEVLLKEEREDREDEKIEESENFDNIEEEDIFDFEGDDSFQKFVSPDISFSNIGYIPNDLTQISGEYLIDTKGNQTLRGEALENLQELSRDFFNAFGVKIPIISAYRSYEYQKGIKQRGCSDYFCAKAGYSEHQSGLAVDIFEATDQQTFLSKPNYEKYFLWMSENAHKYGFHNSYQNGRDIDGYEREPWHWRYMGSKLATILYNNKQTFTQYFLENGKSK